MRTNWCLGLTSRRLGVGTMTVAAMTLVACGGGGGEVTKSTGNSLLSPVVGQECEFGSPPTPATTTLNVTATHYCGNNPAAPPSTCSVYYPSVVGLQEVRSQLAPAHTPLIQLWDGTALSTLATLPAWLSTTVTGNILDWSATDSSLVDYQVVGVIVKNGGDTHVYDYSGDPTATGDTALYPPHPGNPILNWYNVCFVAKPKVTEKPQWCSPGYWKNHTDSWTISQSLKYTDYYDASTLAIKTNGRECADASANASIFDVISKPQCYGGEAANKVADLLSAKYGLNFTGERVENCPLN